MKKLMSAVILIAAVLLQGADYAELNKAAAAAAKAKDYAGAEAKYTEAMKAAINSVQKSQAIMGKYQALRSQKKWKESEEFMTEAVEDEMLKPEQIRYLLNMFAASYLWTNRYEFGLSLLQQAQNQQCPKTSNAYYNTYYYMATIYLRKKQPQAAIEALSEVMKVKGVHPANLYTGSMTIGSAYEKLGKKEEALKCYQQALNYGKQVKYKFDYSPAQKAIDRLSK